MTAEPRPSTRSRFPRIAAGAWRGFGGRALRDLALLLGLTLIAAAGTKVLHPHAPAWFLQPEADEHAVTLDTIRERWSGMDLLWIDARTATEYAEGHQSGAIRLTMNEWNDLLYDHFDTLSSATAPKIVYCDGAKCGKSKQVAQALRDLGIPEVYYLLGGWDALREGR